MEINGKIYPMWGQFVGKKAAFVGGTLQDSGDLLGAVFDGRTSSTEITDILLRPNGKDSAFFEVKGKDFSCGFDVAHGGLMDGEKDWVNFYGYGGHKWRIRPKDDCEEIK
jgi:hypothetical protein